MIASDFAYTTNFPTLTTQQIQNGINAVEAQFAGALLLWATLAEPIRTNKRTLIENLLVAWYLSDIYPQAVSGIVSNGGLPLTSKSIGGTSVSFKDISCPPGLENLVSNTFGMQALQMLKSAPEAFTIYG